MVVHSDIAEVRSKAMNASFMAFRAKDGIHFWSLMRLAYELELEAIELAENHGLTNTLCNLSAAYLAFHGQLYVESKAILTRVIPELTAVVSIIPNSPHAITLRDCESLLSILGAILLDNEPNCTQVKVNPNFDIHIARPMTCDNIMRGNFNSRDKRYISKVNHCIVTSQGIPDETMQFAPPVGYHVESNPKMSPQDLLSIAMQDKYNATILYHEYIMPIVYREHRHEEMPIKIWGGLSVIKCHHSNGSPSYVFVGYVADANKDMMTISSLLSVHEGDIAVNGQPTLDKVRDTTTKFIRQYML